MSQWGAIRTIDGGDLPETIANAHRTLAGPSCRNGLRERESRAFASLDQTEPYGQESPPGGWLPVEVGHPHATTEHGEYVLRFNVGSALDDRSFTLFVIRRRTA